MKIISALIVSICFSSAAIANCVSGQIDKLDYEVSVEKDAIVAAGNHGSMDKVVVRVPLKFEGLPLAKIELTSGEISEFWAPIAFTKKENLAVTEIIGYDSSIRNFELAIYYEIGKCFKATQFELYRNNSI